MNTPLLHTLKKVTALTSSTTERMFQLMESNYNHVLLPMFLADLNKKDYVGLLYDENQVLQGFTTYAINPNNCGTGTYNVIFSGDTIISPECWGTQEMMRSWCHTVGNIIATNLNKKWYWYLLSKGHRTYMYLPLFFNDYFPSLVPAKNHRELEFLTNEISEKIFPDYWQKEEGIIRFNTKMGELKPEHNEGTYLKKKKPQVAFFLERNPLFYEGEELVCLAQIHPDNMSGAAQRYVLEGMQNPLF